MPRSTWRWTRRCWKPCHVCSNRSCVFTAGRNRRRHLAISKKFPRSGSATHLRPLIRRPTGGGIVPHDADWTYSAVFPPGHEWHSFKAEESYRRIHDWLRRAFAELKIATELAPCCKKSLPGQCFAGHEKFDLLWSRQKNRGRGAAPEQNGIADPRFGATAGSFNAAR